MSSGWFVSRQGSGRLAESGLVEVGVQQVEDHPDQAPLEHSQRLALGLARRLEALQVGLSGWMDAQLGNGDAVQRRVQLAVAHPGQPVAVPGPRRARQRRGWLGLFPAGRSPLATGAAIRGCRALGMRARVEAHTMATGPLLGRGEDAESIEDNRFISPTDTRGA